MTDRSRLADLPADHPLALDVRGIEEALRHSDFYFICARPEMLLDPLQPIRGRLNTTPAASPYAELPRPLSERRHIRDGRVATEEVREAGHVDDYAFLTAIENGLLRDEFVLDIHAILRDAGAEPDSVTLEYSPEGLRVHDGSLEAVRSDTAELIEWFSTDKLVHDRSENLAGITGLDRFRDFLTYDLLYVGIAKTTDAFDRIYTGVHHALQRILTAEDSRRDGSRVSDEVCILGFRLIPQPWDEEDEDWEQHRTRVKIDAEKAFIRALDPKYNRGKYLAYPQSEDGLWGRSYNAYYFTILEDLTVRTAAATLRGSRSSPGPSNAVDAIFVTRDSVTVAPLVAES